MKFPFAVLIAGFAFFVACQPASKQNETDKQDEPVQSNKSAEYFELRTYYAAEGKLENLLTRFRDHTTGLFEKHGMVNIGYWIPVENNDEVLIYLLGYRNRLERDASWTSFREDPAWISAYQASRENGPLIDSVKNVFLIPTDFSSPLEIKDAGPRIFELRTYYTFPDRLMDLHNRFKNHTMEIFEDNGMTNVAYFDFDSDQPGFESVLLYFITHPTIGAAGENWQSFLNDPKWQSAYEESIENGKLIDSLTSVFLQPVDFSPIK